MSWIQLGLFLEGSLPKRLDPKKRKLMRRKFKLKKIKPESKSKPIKRQPKKPGYVVLAPGELDDDINF